MAWISKKKIGELENKIKELRDELHNIPKYDDEIKELRKTVRVVSYGVEHKLSARIAFNPDGFWAMMRSAFLRLYIDGKEYEAHNIPEISQWLTKLDGYDSTGIQLKEDDLVSVSFKVKDERIEEVEILLNYKQGNYIFKTHERKDTQKKSNKSTKKK